MARNAWCELVTETWFFANQAWERDREEVALGYATEMAEYEESHPRPRLADVMKQLSHGPAPDEVTKVEPGEMAA